MKKRSILEGLRVTDFCWLGAGAYTTKLLADFGADVIKIETIERLDSLRMAAPYKDGKAGINRSGYFADRNTSKRSMALDMKQPEALAIATKLIKSSDIVANNFTPGVMEKFGLSYEEVRRIKPDIIYLSMSMNGSSGPERDFLGYGASMVALTGLQDLTGQPGRDGTGPGTNYPDHVPNPCHAAFALLAAIRHRRRTGEGQRIDLAQIEPMIALMGPTILDRTVNGRKTARVGNEHSYAAPHGVYPCAGEDRWIAIAVLTDEAWHALCAVLGNPDWSRDTAWATSASRWEQRHALDERLAAETRHWTAEALMGALQARGVAAGVVQNARDVMVADPQLAWRRHWVKMTHPEMGETVYNAPPFRFSSTRVELRGPAPLLGQHTREIARELLDLDDARIDDLVERGVFR